MGEWIAERPAQRAPVPAMKTQPRHTLQGVSERKKNTCCAWRQPQHCEHPSRVLSNVAFEDGCDDYRTAEPN